MTYVLHLHSLFTFFFLVILKFQGTSLFKVIKYIAHIIIYNYYVIYKYYLY
jgi:hypothetical protein